MRRQIGLLVLAGCALSTWAILPVWQSETALWTDAVAQTDVPRPALNLAWQALKEGDVGDALRWDTEALARSARHPQDAAIVHRLVQAHIRWILSTSTSTDICDGPPWASWCVAP